MTDTARVKIVSGGSFHNTTVTVDGAPLLNCVGLTFNVSDSLASVTLNLIDVDLELDAAMEHTQTVTYDVKRTP